jgi:hypothetical protein
MALASKVRASSLGAKRCASGREVAGTFIEAFRRCFGARGGAVSENLHRMRADQSYYLIIINKVIFVEK